MRRSPRIHPEGKTELNINHLTTRHHIARPAAVTQCRRGTQQLRFSASCHRSTKDADSTPKAGQLSSVESASFFYIHTPRLRHCPTLLLVFLAFLLQACGHQGHEEADRLNEIAYNYHYKNLDSTRIYAQRAYRASANYVSGQAEALNNLAFVRIAKMDYDGAYRLLDSIKTNNQIENLVANIQYMRLCQRQSKNKDLYDYRERARRCVRRINEEKARLTPHQRKRFVYAESELAIVESAYFYYLGLKPQSVEAIYQITPNEEIKQDTAQYLNYLYNIGAGGIIQGETNEEISQREFEYLVRCYQLAADGGYPFFQAQAMQALSEHLQSPLMRDFLIANNLPAIWMINIDDMPDTLLAGNLAQRARDIFANYGDVYQIAGANRTLAECFWQIKDYPSAEICLKDALMRDTVINRAPDLVASIREQLSLVYSAIDDKKGSDENRNIYLDMQEQTRQDRQLEARAGQLKQTAAQLNRMLWAIIFLIAALTVLLVWLVRKRKHSNQNQTLEELLQPLKEWEKKEKDNNELLKENDEELREEIDIARLHLINEKQLNIEQRAKISLVNTITPLIDRMLNEVRKLTSKNEAPQLRAERYKYIVELTDSINECNATLTNWIQMRQGELSLHIESFPLQSLFNIVKKSRMGFQLKGITLSVEDSNDIVKADKTLTLFMLNTIADNARKYTPQGGRVQISAKSEDNYVEISIKDDGPGMTEDKLKTLFDHKPLVDERADEAKKTTGAAQKSHGFGLMNCKGIIEKYKKTSQIFSVCSIYAQSQLGQGTRIAFRLPKGIARSIVALLLLLPTAMQAEIQKNIPIIDAYADSIYESNLKGTYQHTLELADSCIKQLNNFYTQQQPRGRQLMTRYAQSADAPAELQWFRDSLHTDYNAILSMRNECAVAALALHDWSLYRYNNDAYTSLFREMSADRMLDKYCRIMQKSENNKIVAIIILTILLISILPAYYIFYARHRIYFKLCVARINSINKILLSDLTARQKLDKINTLWDERKMMQNPDLQPLNRVVGQIKQALTDSAEASESQQTLTELAEDELRRIQYEDANYHISNNVMDNCLSTLKHETMYYPPRIRHLIDGTDNNLDAIAELATYYQELYYILSLQATRQTEAVCPLDNETFDYLLQLLQKQNAGQKPILETHEKADQGSQYMQLTLQLPHLDLTETQASKLFTPETHDARFLICRQIIRDAGEAANARGCGIAAHRATKGTNVEITITKEIWKNLKSSS